MTFRDQAAADLPTFVNVDEFGSTVNIDGAPVTCVLIADENMTISEGDGISLLESLLYVRARDLSAAPEVRQRMTLDGRKANVMRVDQEQGLLVIRLRWFQS